MPSSTIDIKQNDTCHIHGAPARAANRTLLLLLLAAFALIVWRIWVHGPSGDTVDPKLLKQPFLPLLGHELWNLLFDGHGIVAELWDVFPYFIVGILLAGYIRTYKIAVKMQATLRRHGILSIFLASLVGLITPLCACGTLTTAISLLFAGLPLAPVMALLVTSPLMSPSTYLLTLNDLGAEWTAIRTGAAFLLGMLAGIVTHLLRDRGFRTESIFIEGAIPRGDFHDEAYPDDRLRCNCKERFGHRVAARTSSMFVIFLAKSSEMLWMVGKYVLVGVAAGAVVERYMPYAWIYGLFGRQDPLNIVWVTLGTVPIFLHQISASSILFHIKSSLQGTLDGGAALAFLIGGPVTAMPTMVLFWTVFKKRVFVLYLLICVIGTIAIAYGFQYAVFVPGVDTGNPLLRGVSKLSGGASSVLTKEGKLARIVMDPGGKPLIATYSNDIAGHGGIVFDAGPARLLSAVGKTPDDAVYVRNIAEWLEQGNTAAVNNRILIYDTGLRSSRGMDAGPVIGLKALAELARKKFQVTLASRSDVRALTGSILEGYSQLWLIVRGEGTHISDAEMETIAQFNRSGKGMLVAAGNGGDGDPAQLNRIATRYGIRFSGAADRGPELTVARAADLLARSSRLLGNIL